MQSWKNYISLKLNGINYSSEDLIKFSVDKVGLSGTSEWEKSIFRFILEWLGPQDNIEVKTSGSTGQPKAIQLEKDRMVSSAKATNSFFELKENNTVLLCLSAEYIAGKMMIVRAFVGGFDMHISEPSRDVLSENKTNFDFVAVVPLQLEDVFIQKKSESLNKIKQIIVGGAAVSSALCLKLDNCSTEIWSTYGMTETITHIALQKINGKDKTDYFQALPNVYFDVDKRDCLCILAPKIHPEEIVTNDKVELINYKQFRFLGRADFVINSGGIKVSPELIEKKIALLIGFNNVISSKKDKELGEKVVLIIDAEKQSENWIANLKINLEKALERFERPKEIHFISELPKTKTGKLDRKALKKWLETIK